MAAVCYWAVANSSFKHFKNSWLTGKLSTSRIPQQVIEPRRDREAGPVESIKDEKII
jgi:hypothetical protein